jgi:hypothetical protein
MAKAKVVIDRALKAHGGVARIKAFKEVSTRSSIAIQTPNGNVEGELLMAVRMPDKSRIEMGMLGQRGIQVLNGDKGWTTSGGPVQELTAEQTQAMRAGLKVQVLPLLARLASGTSKVGYVGADVVGSDSVDVVVVVDPDATSKASFSRTTGLLVRLEQEEASMFGEAKLLTARFYTDYRDVNGWMVPFKIERYARGQLLIADSISAYEINKGGSETPFLRPNR